MKIQFPGLWGLEFEFKNWAFEVFDIKIFWYGIIIALAFLVAVLLGIRSCKKYDIEPDNILDLVLFAAPAAIICARLYYVIFSWDQFKDNLIEIFWTRNGGLAVYGGVIGAILVAWLYARKKKMPFLHLMDFTAPYIALGQSIGRWGNFVNQEAFGMKTNLPWRMNGSVANEYLTNLQENLDLSKWGVHPTFLYESLWDIAIFLFLLFFRKKKKIEGEVLFMYLILYGAGRFFIEGLRTDSLMLGSLRVSQLLSLLLVLLFTSLFIYRRVKKGKEADKEPVDLGLSQYGSVLMKMKEEEREEESKDSAELNVKTDEGTDEGTAEDSTEKTAEDSAEDSANTETEDMEETFQDTGKDIDARNANRTTEGAAEEEK